jgi:hypothetical protein
MAPWFVVRQHPTPPIRAKRARGMACIWRDFVSGGAERDRTADLRIAKTKDEDNSSILSVS